MTVIEELIRKENNGKISFGNYSLDKKSKVSDFEHNGDLYKVKTFKEITKLEKNGLFVYESVPGTTVVDFSSSDKGVSFGVEAEEDVQITLELEPEKEFRVLVDEINVGKMKTNLGGKLVLSVELSSGKQSKISVVKL